MKHNTPLLTSASLLLLTMSPGSLASVELGKGFSVIGQFDAAYRSTDPDNGSSSQSLHTNEFQLDFDYNHESGLYAHIELESATGPDGEDKSRTEAMFIGRNWEHGGIKVGRFISPSGYEGAEPWDRFTRTTAFGGVYAYLQNGVAGYYTSGIFNVYGAIVDGAWTADEDFSSPGAEVQFGITTDAFVSRLTMAYEDYGNDLDQKRMMLNLWGQYQYENLTLAAEINLLEDMDRQLYAASLEAGPPAINAWKGRNAMLFAKYAFDEHWMLGLRYAQTNYDDINGLEVANASSFTITPRYQIFNDDVQWDVRADIRFQNGDNKIAGVDDGTLFELGTTLRF